MTELSTLIDLQLTIFLLMAAGYLLTKIGVLPLTARKPLTDLVINFILPCNILVSFMVEFNAQILLSCLSVLLISLGIQLVTWVAGLVLYRGVEPDKQTSLRYATSVSNGGFIGLPIVQGLYGTIGALYTSVYLIPQRIVMWSAGVSCYTGTKGKGVLKKVLTHPCVVSVFVGLALMISQVPLPRGLVMPIQQASNATTSMTMLIIGNILAEVDLRTVFDKTVLQFCAIRLVLIPALVLLVCRLLGIDALVTASSVILSGMPAAATTAILAAKYDRDARFAVKIVCASTVLSLLTIPLFCLAMEHL